MDAARDSLPSFETHRYAMLLRMRSFIFFTRSSAGDDDIENQALAPRTASDFVHAGSTRWCAQFAMVDPGLVHRVRNHFSKEHDAQISVHKHKLTFIKLLLRRHKF
jgi:hypothetical protein